MQQAPIVILLDTLSDISLGRLKKWLRSPFFNHRQDVIDLFELYLKFRRKKELLPDKKNMYQLLFLNEPYDDHRIRMVMSFLKRQTEQFLIYECRKEDKVEEKIILSRIYRERNLNKYASQTLKKAEKTLTCFPYRNAKYLRLKYHFYCERLDQETDGNRTETKCIQEVLDNLDRSYFLEKLKTTCLALHHTFSFKTHYDIRFLKEVLRAFEENFHLRKEPTYRTLYACYQNLMNQSSLAAFNAYKELLFQYQHLFSPKERIFLFMTAVEPQVHQFNKGDQAAIKRIFEIYQYIDTHKIFSTYSVFIFKNIVNVGNINQAYEWVEQFIERNQHKVVGNNKASIIKLAHVSCKFFQKKYEEVLPLLREVQFDDLYHKISAKNYILMSLFKLKEMEAFDAHLKSFISFIRRHPEIGYQQQQKINSALTLQKISRLNPYDKVAKEALRAEVVEMDNLAQKPWFLACIDEL